ncbi:amino acid adenylation domain-containing protein [Hahella aquimaris]|uniref:non-ribosomal peptide synthetase/type I polyketide synthase n=1 Tax=Hahella sp. HNIBRBA332 TaxID=3015983 RepID=UPI00273BCAB2|nr:non-ribosomal peptide synthetase/type I polyketide synthase [Hahella sp. HNIBRBA332]WLQ16679.1 amino acid adenylation domain-containing protein [Hahella sp. HNIBRBA332]
MVTDTTRRVTDAARRPFYADISRALQSHAITQGDADAFVFLTEDRDARFPLTYAALDRQARRVAALLRRHAQPGERVLLLFHPGLEFLAAFFGCLYAGVTAIPMHPPKKNRSAERLDSILDDADTRVILANDSVVAAIADSDAGDKRLQEAVWLTVDAGLLNPATDDSENSEDSEPASLHADDLAFLQYTSGSTSAPKGVMVSHRNLILNLDELHRCYDHDADSIVVSWLPHFHDLGLIYAILTPLYAGSICYLMAPATFIRNPARWLQAISDCRATHSAAPNFAYQLCIDKISAEQKQDLDLSCWKAACNAAEPVRYETLRDFAATFSDCGFDYQALSPSYGLAEATVKVSITPLSEPPTVLHVEREALSQGEVKIVAAGAPGSTPLVGSGRVDMDTKSLIVDTATRTPCLPDRIGEIWVRGPSVASGYWARPEATSDIFDVHLADPQGRYSGPYLRTGDLGFIHGAQLFITGRRKDLLIIDGVNYYPQDIEKTVFASHPDLTTDNGAAFSVDIDGEERLVIVQEVKRTAVRQLDGDAVARAIRQAVFLEHELPVHAIALLKPLQAYKTTSGKIQRQANRKAWLDDSLQPIYQWRAGARDDVTAQAATHTQTQKISQTATPSVATERLKRGAPLDAKDLVDWLTQQLAAITALPAEDIDANADFASFGLASRHVVALSGELERYVGVATPPTLFYQHPNIARLAASIAALTSGAPSAQKHGGAAQVKRKAARLVDVEATPFESNDPIAIVGMGCRFPGADNPQALWRLLNEGVDAIRETPPERWSNDAYYHQDAGVDGRMNTRWGGFLDNIDQFDPQFFGIAPREAETMDPQQRLLLEVCWEALEDAGIAVSSLAGSDASVFMGVCNTEFQRISYADRNAIRMHTGTGAAASVASGRISYLWDLRGPAMTIDTACSSSLVAVHQACESLRRNESSLALAGGVNLILLPGGTISLSQGRMMSPTGRCKTFDAEADGYVRGEGCGVVILKRLADARRDGDEIYALIRGSSVNQDGHSNGLTAPNGQAQQDVIRSALFKAEVQPCRIRYVEAHGTGTALGDPIEVNSLRDVLEESRDADHPCSIGSIKTNIGHLEAAAGVAGLIKTALALKHRVIPGSLHLRQRNPLIDIDERLFHLPQRSEPWDGELLAGVSSFGFSGSNAHVVLQGIVEAPAESASDAIATATVPPADDAPYRLLTLSAADAQALKALARGHGERLTTLHANAQLANGAGWADYCHTLNSAREALPYRLALSAQNSQDAAETLKAFQGQEAPNLSLGVARHAPVVVFLFSGQGAQYPGMMRRLYETEPVVRDTLERCEAVAAPLLGQSLLTLMFNPDPDSGIHQTRYTQPALFACEAALARLWMSWGVQPQLALGHSVGEYAAAHAAGLFSLEQGMKLVLRRGELMQSLPAGEMLALFAPRDKVEALLQDSGVALAVAADNGPDLTVISGRGEAMAQIRPLLSRQEIRFQSVQVSHAFHSPMMAPILPDLRKVTESTPLGHLQFPLLSNVTGDFIEAEDFEHDYWLRHTMNPVEFRKCMLTAADRHVDLFLEIGPGASLCGMGKRCLPDSKAAWVHSIRYGEDEQASALNALGRVYCHGGAPDWRTLPGRRRLRDAALPSYPFQRHRYWPQNYQEPHANADRVADGHPLLGRATPLADPTGDLYDQHLDASAHAYLAGHKVSGAVVFPGAAYIDMALSAAGRHWPDAGALCRNMQFHAPLVVDDLDHWRLQTQFIQTDADAAQIKIFARRDSRNNHDRRDDSGAPWRLHASCEVRRQDMAEDQGPHPRLPSEAALAQYENSLSGEQFYAQWRQRGNDWSGQFQGIQRLWSSRQEAWALIQAPAETTAQLDAYRTHPAVLDACAQTLAALGGDEKGAFFGHSVQNLRLLRNFSEYSYWVRARLTPQNASSEHLLSGSLAIFDTHGDLLAEVEGLRFSFLNAAAGHRPEAEQGFSFKLTWERTEIAATPETTLTEDRQTDSDADAVFANESSHLALRRYGSVLLCIAPEVPEDSAEPDELLDNLVEQLEAILEALDASQEDDEDTPRLWLLTRRAFSVTETDAAVCPYAAALWGLGRALAVEKANHWGGMVDLDPEASARDQQSLLDAILGQDGGADAQFAIRHGAIYRATLGRTALTTSENRTFPLRADASYLITGGLGDLGLRWARWLAEQGARRLVLMGRNGLPPRSDWTQLSPDSRDGRRVAALHDIEALGAQVTIAAVNLSDDAACASWLQQYQQQQPAIRGVLHAAGVAHAMAVETLDRETLRKEIAAKVCGGETLRRCFPVGSLDFLLLFSSTSAALPSPRLAAYAAANAWLDGLAAQRRAQGERAVSVQWGAFRDIGLMARAQRDSDTSNVGLTPATGAGLAPDACVALTPALLTANHAVIGVTQEDASLAAYADGSLYLQGLKPVQTDAPASANGATEENPASLDWLDQPQEQRQAALLRWMTAQAAAVLRLNPDNLDPAAPLTQYGLDSLMAVELRNRIEKALSANVSIVDILKSNGLDDLTRSVADKLARQGAESGASAATENLPAPLDCSAPWELSYNQQAQWFLHQLDPTSPAYHVSFATRLRAGFAGEQDQAFLQAALNQIARRHPALRTAIQVDSKPRQQARDDIAIPLQVVNAHDLDASTLYQEVRRAYQTPFELSRAPLLRACAFVTAQDNVLLLTAHHAVCDGWSLWVILDELKALYEARRAGVAPEQAALPPLTHSQVDFVRWQNAMLDTERGEQLWHYWRDALADADFELNLPADLPRQGAARKAVGESIHFQLAPQLDTALRTLAKQRGATLFSLMLAAYQLLLHRLCGQQRVIVATPVHGRSRPEFQPLVGDFVNLAPVNSRFDPEQSLDDYLRSQQETLLDALAHGDYPLPLLVERLGLQRNGMGQSLVKTTFIMQKPQTDNATLDLFLTTDDNLRVTWGDLQLSPYPMPQQEGQFELSLEIADSANGLQGFLKYDANRWSRTSIARLVRRYRHILSSLSAAGQLSRPLTDLPWYDQEERRQLEQNASEAAPADARLTAPDLVSGFLDMVRAYPERIAVADNASRLSYAELNQRANGVAACLREQGTPAGAAVGLCVSRSVDLIVGLLGILKSGCGYLPLDPAHPPARLSAQLADAGVAALVTDRAIMPTLAALEGLGTAQWLCVEDVTASEEEPEVAISLDSLAYLIYTSGSTGAPKGTLVEHHSVINLVNALWDQVYHRYDQPIAVALCANTVFDASVQQIFAALLLGHRLVIVDADSRRDPARLVDLLSAEQVRCADCTPSLLGMLTGADQAGRLTPDSLLVGGEALPMELVRAFYNANHHTTLINVYGPTECCVDVSACALERDALPQTAIAPLGRPLRGAHLFVLDPWGQPAPTGAIGEIVIAGAGVSRGYLKRPELQTEKFVALPEFNAARAYRTGDLGRWLDDGRLHYLGRRDAQVKIRGHRVELGDIESQLAAHDAIAECAVALFPQRQQLAAYVVYRQDANPPPSAQDLQIYLRDRLPEYMIPAYLLALPRLPMNASGKLDRRALPEPEGVAAMDGGAPVSEVERRVADIWRHCLNLSRVGRDDNFFDLGGHSLLLAQVQRQLSDAFGRPVAMVDLFANPTVAATARLLSAAPEEDALSQAPRRKTNRLAGRRNAKEAQRSLRSNEQL